MSTFPGWYTETNEAGEQEEVRPFPSRTLTTVILALLSLSTILALISTMWQHIGAVAAANSISAALGGAVSNRVGAASMALGWAAVGVIAVSTIGVVVMFISIALLEKLTDDDGPPTSS